VHLAASLQADDRATRIEEAFERSLRALADSWEPVPGGWSMRTGDVPLVWTLNQVRVTDPVTVDDLVEVADLCQADLPYRHVVVRDAATIAAVEPALVERGWRVEHDVVMALSRRDADAPDPRVIDLSEDEMLSLMSSWLTEERDDVSAAGLAQVLEYNLRDGRHFDERRLGARDADGRAVAVTKARVDGTLGWVEDVYTLPEARRRGLARALVGRAADLVLAAGCTLVTIVADADDWPQHLYARVGFTPISRASIYHLEPTP
jgi:GNAT superfamily N-acetyltransferase